MSILKSAQRAAVAVAAVLACMGAQAAGSADQFFFTQDPSPVVVGGTVVITWHDIGVTNGFDESTVVLQFDPTVFSLVSAAAGSVFGAGAITSSPTAVDVDFGTGSLVPGWQYSVSGGSGASGAASGMDVFSVTLRLDHWTPSASTAVYFIDPVGPGMPANYYSFESAGVAVQAVPEPATVASMLAGLVLLAGVGARRRRTGAVA